jgi:integrase
MKNKSKVKFNLRRPSKGQRRSFSIDKQVCIPGQKSKSETLKDERIEAINKAFKSGLINEHRATLQAKDVVKDLYRQHKLETEGAIVYNSENQKVLKKFFEKEYTGRELVDECSIKNDFTRAIEALGSISIISSTPEQLQKAIDSKIKKANKQRRVVSRLNSLLKFIQRDFKLKKKPKEYEDVKHLNLANFKKAVANVEDLNMQVLCWVAIGTGCRLGEIFALQPNDFRKNVLHVTYQIDKKQAKRRTKNKKARKVSAVPECLPYLQKWFKIDSEVKEGLRNARHADIIREACSKAFPGEVDKHLVFHDLRHSHAIHLLNQGVSLSLVAQQLGNSFTVCQDHYTGFTLSDDGVDAIANILKKA